MLKNAVPDILIGHLPLSKKQEVLSLLEEHITENIVKIGPNYYRQTVGVSQGLPSRRSIALSSIKISRRSFRSLWMIPNMRSYASSTTTIHNDQSKIGR
ncbi:hypothetical protein BDZ97DRAFT_1874890 [Flammula alnicola]|nr:hypothetical protein BDZ97DRAFT_1874890 [Flammula alnicola]